MSVGNIGVVANLGYPRIGEHCQWKEALERFWAGHISQAELHRTMKAIRLQHIDKQAAAGVGIIPVGDFSLYDHVLDHSVAFGLVPERYAPLQDDELQLYYAMARGTDGITACESAPWFHTNYHYVVPEWSEGFPPRLNRNHWLELIQEAPAAIRSKLRPVIIGPYSFAKLVKGYPSSQFEPVLRSFIPVYIELLAQLSAAGIEWVQFDEPSLSQTSHPEDCKLLQEVYESLRSHSAGIKLMLQTYFGAVPLLARLFRLPVDGIGLDFVHDGGAHRKAISELGFPKDKLLGAGIVDGSNVWRTDLSAAWSALQGLLQSVPADRLILQPSCSLIHVPVTVKNEHKLPYLARLSFAFADEKLDELAILSRGLREGRRSIALELSDCSVTLQALAASPSRSLFMHGRSAASHQAVIGSLSYNSHKEEQSSQMTTQTFGRLSHAEVGDLLEHNEMLEWLGKQLDGYLFTTSGWTQRKGSDCVKQPIIFGDIMHVMREVSSGVSDAPASAPEITRSLLRGALTGPLAMLHSTFVRTDLSCHMVALQFARAIHSLVNQLDKARTNLSDESMSRDRAFNKYGNWEIYLHWGDEACKHNPSVRKESKLSHIKPHRSGIHDGVTAI
ncbi:hypothetical protein [Paenibacillus spongiae]|uniref:5-methyltetrahydropteroyltriglutamate--homocysteine S-methyltransferase n=1 Tax=Paenibacillus spongiae TaxID=2909671 RepID=A0ABY5S8U3_9BACL|nr:hypothetical protein [Paenibacillus spongiae]UVI28723.1 hypothetical protein L1F29_25275 [Paenibacillus spongiae]